METLLPTSPVKLRARFYKPLKGNVLGAQKVSGIEDAKALMTLSTQKVKCGLDISDFLKHPYLWSSRDICTMLEPIKILIVEDNVNDAELLMNQLHRTGFDVEWERVDTELDYLIKLRPELDLIISDYTLPQFNGFLALDLLKSRGYEIPFIMVSGTMGEERAVEALKHGAADYLMKDRMERLGSAVRQALEQNRLRRGFRRAEAAVLEGERKFRALFDAAHDAIYVLHNGVFVDCNTKGQFMYGRTWNEIVGHTPDEFAPPNQPDGSNSREKAFGIVMKAMLGEPQKFEWMVHHKDGRT